jgi:hypothetical protein
MNNLVAIRGLGACPCMTGVGAMEIIPPTFEDDSPPPTFPARQLLWIAATGAAVIALAVVGLVYITRKKR